MPQLCPDPWFLIFLMSWLIYLTILPKTSRLKMLNNPMMKINKNMFKSWIWPWT